MANDVVLYEGLHLYDWQKDEPLLVNWYSEMLTSGEHYQTFTPELRYLSTFLEFFKHPNRRLIYAADKGGIWFAFWIESHMSGAFFGLWGRADRRASLTMLKNLQACFYLAFKAVTVLIAVTKQPKLRTQLERLGAQYGMTIPALWDGDSVEVYTMTRDQWNKRYAAYMANKDNERKKQ